MLIDLSDKLNAEGKVFPGQGVVLEIQLKDKTTGLLINDSTLKLWVQDEGFNTRVIPNGTLLNPSPGIYQYVHCALSAGKTHATWISNTTKVRIDTVYRVQHPKIDSPTTHMPVMDVLGGGLIEVESTVT